MMKTLTQEPGEQLIDTEIIEMKKASIAVIKRGDLVLTVSRRNDLTDMGLPGGKIEENETEIEGLIREVLEETGIQIHTCQLLTIREGFEHEVYVFEAIGWTGQAQSIEGTTIKWLTRNQLAEQKTFGSFNREVMELIDRRNSNENATTTSDADHRLIECTISNTERSTNQTYN